MTGQVASTRIWDLPIRVFHWLLAIGVVLQFGTAKYGWLDMQWHFWIGYGLLVLLLFRVAWGFVGSDSARFHHFIVGPRRLLDYLRNWSTTPMSRFAGHNPAGGWATAIILAVLLAQSLSGLASSDEMEWFGPLSHKLPDHWIVFATWLHHRLEPVILIVAALHVVAIALYRLLKRDSLVGSMWHGRRGIEITAPKLASNGRAIALLSLIAAGVAALIYWADGKPVGWW
jgi:cytochrome b